MYKRKSLTALLFMLAAAVFPCGTAEARTHLAKQGQRDTGQKPAVIVFWEDGFPAADTAQPSRSQLSAMLSGAAFLNADHLSEALGAEETTLLVMPFGSAFPEEEWPAIHGYLARGGNLLVLGGRPFTRAAYKEKGKEREAWKLRPPIQAFARSLFLNDYQETPGSDVAAFAANEEFSFLALPAFTWKRAWSATVRLTDEDLYKREGSAGSLDARLDTLAWGVVNGRKLAAPIIEIDHLQNQFAGGRWMLVACELGDGFFASAPAKELVSKLAKRAEDSAEDFTVQPSWPVFLPGEPLTFTVHWQRFGGKPPLLDTDRRVLESIGKVELEFDSEGAKPEMKGFNLFTQDFPLSTQLLMPTPVGRGIYKVTAKLYIGEHLGEVWRTGFWIRDDEVLHSGPKLGKSGDYFTVDGKPMVVAGTTYMASDVQREFFLRPNPWLWDHDMAQIHAAGINTLRTGWWTAWDQVMKQSGVMHEEMFRALEAYLLCARKNGLAVQFTFFAFTPEVLGGDNPYLDPEAIRRQKELLGAFAERFHDVPYLAWDLINEPSFSNPQKTWMTRPNGDVHELAAWNAWLAKQYADRGAIAEAWRNIPVAKDAQVPLPAEPEFSSRAAYEAWPSSNALRAMDYEHFAQDSFRDWTVEMVSAIRGAGSHQLITVGEDEGGGEDRPSPAFFGDAVDFTTTHTWWASDALLWDSLVAKLPGEPMLVQETGISHELRLDGEAHRSLAEETALFERKLAMAAGTSAGAIEWLWNVNAFQRDDREATIGAIRPDGTEKPEADLMRRFAKFAGEAGPHMAGAALPGVAIVTSQALQFSPLQNLATEAQQKSVRALHYLCNVPGYVIPENRAARLAELKPKLAILPSAQALSDEAWKQLMDYVAGGGTLLVTGSIERDAHWRVTQRLAALGAPAAPEAILLRGAIQRAGGQDVALNFGFDKQQAAEMLHFADGETLHTIAHGKGHVIIASEPIEFAEGLRATAQLYAWALAQAGVQSPYQGKAPEAVLVRPVELADSVLYLIVSESANEEEIAVRDRTTGAEIKTKLAPGRAQLWLIDKSGGQILARFGE